jgi:hypothetical protein
MADENNLEIAFKEITTTNGLFCQFEDQSGVLFLDIKNPLTADDFKTISNIIDPYFVEHGELAGVIINAKKFPYWKGSKNRSEYLNFAGENHYKFKKAALSMGGFFTKIIVRLGRSHAHPTIKTFKHNDIEKAQEWILQELLAKQ